MTTIVPSPTGWRSRAASRPGRRSTSCSCSASAAASTNRTQAALEDCAKAHRYTRGLAVIPQGTPTNNTESDRAGWQAAVTPQPPGRTAGTEPAAGSNAAIVAGALGVDGLVFANTDHASEREQPQAHAMNAALWWPSWGTMLDSMSTGDGAKLSDSVREGIRNFFNDSVRGRGPVPALRVGDQPYGILPVGNTDVRWKAQRGDLLDETLLNFLKRVRGAWRVSLPNVPRIDRGGAGLDTTVLDILGSSPVAQGLRVRTVIPSDFPFIVADATGTPQDQQELEKIIGQFILTEVQLPQSSSSRPVRSRRTVAHFRCPRR
jgi:hypothetical protein